jgi:hypoxanthine phosphoribosyltransferase
MPARRERVEQINAIVEKPKPEDAPSTLAVVGRYILTPRIFHHLENIKPGSGGEIQLTDGIASLLGEEQVLAYRYSGARYDCGSKLGYLQATSFSAAPSRGRRGFRCLSEVSGGIEWIAKSARTAGRCRTDSFRGSGPGGRGRGGGADPRATRRRNPLVLCVMTGGVVFCGQLLPRLDFPLDFDYLHATRYGPETQGGKISWRSAPWTSVKERTVLVVDDILDEGVTLAAVKESLKRLGAAEVLLAVFADKLQRQEQAGFRRFRRVDRAGPLRLRLRHGHRHGAWRNLPAIYAVRENKS